jgi:hypothetical protein
MEKTLDYFINPYFYLVLCIALKGSSALHYIMELESRFFILEKVIRRSRAWSTKAISER